MTQKTVFFGLAACVERAGARSAGHAYFDARAAGCVIGTDVGRCGARKDLPRYNGIVAAMHWGG